MKERSEKTHSTRVITEAAEQESSFLAERLLVDTIFREQSAEVRAFVFDEAVALAFDDMAHRSIPLYGEMQRLTARLVEHAAHPGSRVYDLGCATGTTLLCLAARLGARDVELIGVDNSAAMLDRCRARLDRYHLSEGVRLELADIASYPLESAACVIMNYTLQFLPVRVRADLLTRIRRAMEPGGVLILSEKATHTHTALDSMLHGLYYEFKKRNGYSELEISQKREALENVLVPLSVEETTKLLLEAGFSRVELAAKCFQFCTFLAYTDRT